MPSEICSVKDKPQQSENFLASMRFMFETKKKFLKYVTILSFGKISLY
jgi:hypothetical protein